jgi:glycine/serine hydroxymethyltransferase
MKEQEMDQLADFMLSAVSKRNDKAALEALHDDVKTFCRKFPVPGVS